jgi:hypothetical protein
LVVDGKTIETKPIKVVGDPDVQLTEVQRKRYNDMLMDLHEMQRKGMQVQQALNSLFPQMAGVAAKVKESTNVPAAVKVQFESFQKEFDAVRVKFGVPPQAGQGAGRGGGGGEAAGRGAAAAARGAQAPPGGAAAAFPQGFPGGFGGGGRGQGLVNEAGYLKTQIMSFWEMPGDTLMKQYNDVRLALPKAMIEANAVLAKSMAVSDALKKYDITLNASAPVK